MRKYALQPISREAFGFSSADSKTWAAMFNAVKPHYFGQIESQTFSSRLGDHIINKPFVHMTMAQGNIYEMEGGSTSYQWDLLEEAEVQAVITRVGPGIGATGFVGGPDEIIELYLDRPWFEEPAILKTESRDAPMLTIVGRPIPVGNDEYLYKFRLQTGDPSEQIDVAYLQPGKTLIDAGTSVADEMNYLYAGLQFGGMTGLQSHIGVTARNLEITDKFIRHEIAARKNGTRNQATYRAFGKNSNAGILQGHQLMAVKGNGENVKIDPGVFVTAAEALLIDRVYEDVDMMCTFGKAEVIKSDPSQYKRSVPPGWFQMAKDGNYHPHTGNLTLDDFYEIFNQLFTTRKSMGSRKVRLRTGSAGASFLSQLIAAKLGTLPVTLQDTHFINKTTSEFHRNSLGYGFQFTEVYLDNGLELILEIDYSKDDPRRYPELVPGTTFTKESMSFDVFSLDETDAAPARATTKSNYAMVTEPEANIHYMVSNVYDPVTGGIKNGANAFGQEKGVGMFKEMSYGLAIWDISATMRLPFV